MTLHLSPFQLNPGGPFWGLFLAGHIVTKELNLDRNPEFAFSSADEGWGARIP